MKWALYGIFEQLWRMTTQIIGSVGVKAHAMCPTTLLFFMGGGGGFEVDLATFLLSISVLSKSRKSPSLYPGLGLFGDFLGTLLGGLFAVYFDC